MPDTSSSPLSSPEPGFSPTAFRFRVGFVCSFKPREDLARLLHIPNEVDNKRAYVEMVLGNWSKERRAAMAELVNMERIPAGKQAAPLRTTSASDMWSARARTWRNEDAQKKAFLRCVCSAEDSKHTAHWATWTKETGDGDNWYMTKFCLSPEYSTQDPMWTSHLVQHWGATIHRYLLFFAPAGNQFESMVGVRLPGTAQQRLAVLKNLYKMEIKLHEGLRDYLGISPTSQWDEQRDTYPQDPTGEILEAYDEARASGSFATMLAAIDAAGDREALDRARGPALFQITESGWVEYAVGSEPGTVAQPLPLMSRRLGFLMGLVRAACEPVELPDGARPLEPIVQAAQLVHLAEYAASDLACAGRVITVGGKLGKSEEYDMSDIMDRGKFVLRFGLNKLPTSFWKGVEFQHGDGEDFSDSDKSSGAETSDSWSSVL